MSKKTPQPNMLLVAGPNSKYKIAGTEPAGFWVGLWHGLIAPFVFIVSFFNTNIRIYETNNNGKWYDFGFLIGVGALSGSTKSTNAM